MRKLVFWLLLLLVTFSNASAQTLVRGYTKKNGTYVAPYYRSAPDGDPSNNYSTKGNVNPYTGQPGTKNPDGTTSGIQPVAAVSDPAIAPVADGKLRSAKFKADQATLDLATALVKDGWVYTMPTPKSAQAAWGNKDGRTTWFVGYWTNGKTKQASLTQPKRDTDGKLTGDGISGASSWHNGGSPAVPSKIEWLCSKSGGIEPNT